MRISKSLRESPRNSRSEISELDARQDELVRRKFGQVERLRRVVHELEEDVVARENEVTRLEAAAVAHQKKIEDTNSRRAALEDRRVVAEDKKRVILAALAAREEQRLRINKEREFIQRRCDEAERESDELDEIEIELKREEEEYQEKKRCDEEAQRLAADENAHQLMLELERADVERDRRSEVSKMQSRMGEFISKYEQDAANIERRFEQLRQEAAKRTAIAELEQSKWMTMWNDKNENADRIIRDLEGRLRAAESPHILKRRLDDLTVEYQALQRKVTTEQDEIRRLSEGPGGERDLIERMEKETREERERIAKMEHELDAKTLRQQTEEDGLDNRQQEVRLRKDEIESKMNLLRIRNAQAKRTFKVYQRQLASAEQQWEDMRGQHLSSVG